MVTISDAQALGQRLPHFDSYVPLIEAYVRVGDIAFRYVVKKPLGNADFLYLRSVALQGPETFSQVLCLLDDMLATPLGTLADAFSRYYPFPLETVATAALWALTQAIQATTPEVLAAATRDGLTWNLFLYDLVKISLWGKLVAGFFDTTKLEDKEFKRSFEAEWEDLLQYRNPLYGFHVVPKMPLSDFVRYQELKSGRPDIRNMISTFLAHNAKGYPHFITAWAPNFAPAAFAKPLRRVYAPLIERVVQTVLKNMSIEQAQRERLAEDLRKQAWTQYDQAWEAFEFHVPYSGRPSPLGRMGVLGLAESETQRQSFDAFLEAGGRETLAGIAAPEATVNKSVDITPYLFSFFMQSRLDSWVRKSYPADKKTAPTASLDAPDAPEASASGENALQAETPAAIGEDGTPYLTVEQAARRYGASPRQLRYLDNKGHFKALRAAAIPAAAAAQIPPKLRLYPITHETDAQARAALERLKKHASELAPQEYSRKDAAIALQTPVSKLRSLEARGVLHPTKKGRQVVYTAQAIRDAKALLDAE